MPVLGANVRFNAFFKFLFVPKSSEGRHGCEQHMKTTAIARLSAFRKYIGFGGALTF